MKTWLYSGTFDPFTSGHLDVALRAAKLCDQLVIALYDPLEGGCLFSVEERAQMILLATSAYDNIKLVRFHGLVADVFDQVSAEAIVRGVRNAHDLNYEKPMAHINHALDKTVETVFLLARNDLAHVSGSNVRELGKFGRVLPEMVPAVNLAMVEEKFRELARARQGKSRRNDGKQ